MADCLNKITIRLNEPIEQDNGTWLTYINIPCGKCARCLERRKMEWGFRIEQEMQEAKTAYFVTLTYAPEFVPYNKYGVKTLSARGDRRERILKKKRGRKRKVRVYRDDDLTLFIKRLRQHQLRQDIQIEHIAHNLKNQDAIKYYAAGEYGENATKRPHYHLIIFNTTMRAIESAWELGHTHIVKANKATISYVMKYLDKRLGEKQDWRREPEFNTMSEGLGLGYIEKNKAWHKNNIDLLYVTNMAGMRIPMPKYYRLKLFTEEERKEQVKIVSKKLDDEKADDIARLGMADYAFIQNQKRKSSETRFIKKIKKRGVD